MSSSKHEDPSVETDEVEDTDELDDDEEMLGVLGWIWETVRTWGPALLTVLLIRSVVAEPFRIPSGSMVPTMAIGDHILVTKFSYGFRIPLTRIPMTELRAPDRGDVVVFVYPGSDVGKAAYWVDLPVWPFATYDYVKRVVGLPGDIIEVKEGIIYLNGQAQPRATQGDFTFVDDSCRSNPTRKYEENLEGVEHAVLQAATYGMRMANFGPETVPADHVFVMGDNRDHSADSRVWGFVPLRNIKGKSRFVWLSYDQCEGNIPLIGRFRGERFGEPVR